MIRMFVLGRHEPDEVAHLLHTRHVRDKPGHDRRVVTQARRLTKRKTHPRHPAANAQSGEDGFGDQVETGFFESDLFPLLLQIGAEQAELSQRRLLGNVRLSKLQHVPFARVRLAWILDSQLDCVLAGDSVERRFELAAQAVRSKASRLARRRAAVRCACVKQQDLGSLFF